jgi:2-hydroxychromene-2-carboxylate isomerase
MASLDYFIDFKSPAAYLSWQPTLALTKAHNVNLTILPYDTRQKDVPLQQTNESKGETHIRIREIARRDTHLMYAHLQNIPMTFPPFMGATKVALAALLYVKDNPQAFINAAFSAYWCDHQDLNQIETVVTLLAEQGYDAERFAPGIWLAKLDEHQMDAETKGVIDTPCYIAGEQLFIGREHLPWIEKILSAAE